MPAEWGRLTRPAAAITSAMATSGEMASQAQSATPIDPRVDIGHVHLKVADIDRALGFYRDVLGFDVMQRWGDSAAFL